MLCESLVAAVRQLLLQTPRHRKHLGEHLVHRLPALRRRGPREAPDDRVALAETHAPRAASRAGAARALRAQRSCKLRGIIDGGNARVELQNGRGTRRTTGAHGHGRRLHDAAIAQLVG